MISMPFFLSLNSPDISAIFLHFPCNHSNMFIIRLAFTRLGSGFDVLAVGAFCTIASMAPNRAVSAPFSQSRGNFLPFRGSHFFQLTF